MSTSCAFVRWFTVSRVILLLALTTAASAQLTPSDDAYVNSALPTTNYGAATTLNLQSSADTAFIRFDLTAVPAGYTGASVAKATLKLYVNSATTGGSFNVDYVTGTWVEKTITYSLQPTIGTTIAASVPLTTASKAKYVEVDVTSAVVAWLNGTQSNDGIALVANSPLVATFDSKENTGASHPPELDVVFTSGGGITGITTANGSGLTGGGNSGTLNLSLLTSCSSGQSLAWNGSAWACAASGTGTVTSVGLGAPGSDFTVSGSPVTASGTLGLNWNVAPTSTDTANAIVKRDGSGSFAANTVSASLINAVDVTVSDSTVGAATIQGYANATTGSSWGVYGVTNSNASNAYGVVGYATSSSGTPKGVYGVATGATAVGVFGQHGSLSSSGSSFAGLAGFGTWGDGGTAGSPGVLGTADDSYGGYFVNNSLTKESVGALNLNVSGFPFAAYGGVGGNLGCNIDSAGSLNCTGAKHAVVPIDGGARKVALSAIESPKNWFEDFGSAQLASGSIVVALDPDFTQTVNTGVEYHVFLTANGDCKGLYISNRTPVSFEVHELGGGSSSVPFSYRIVALRRNYENVRLEDHSNDPDPGKMMLRRDPAVMPEAKKELTLFHALPGQDKSK